MHTHFFYSIASFYMFQPFSSYFEKVKACKSCHASSQLTFLFAFAVKRFEIVAFVNRGMTGFRAETGVDFVIIK